MDTGHSMKLSSTCRLDKAAGYEGCMAKEAIQMWLHPKMSNREVGMGVHMPSQTWQPVLKQKWDSSYKNQGQAHPSSGCSLTHLACDSLRDQPHGCINAGQTGWWVVWRT